MKRFVKIDSSQNYFCSVRLDLTHLMNSEKLLICDDDIIPGTEFIDFFIFKNKEFPNDVHCPRGHIFLPHEIDTEYPFWTNYQSLRFIGDEAPDQFIHFVHVDACLISKKILLEANSVQYKNEQFKLVDDYLLSYILNYKFKRNLRKLQVSSKENILARTDDSDDPLLALHTRPEVKEARNMLYIHHMINSWQNFEHDATLIDDKVLLKLKQSKWDTRFLGFNVSSKLSEEDMNYLKLINVNTVRIGAVGTGDEIDFDLSSFLSEPYQTLLRLKNLCKELKKISISVILTLIKNLALPHIWELISKEMTSCENIIGYDLINDPIIALDEQHHWTEVNAKY